MVDMGRCNYLASGNVGGRYLENLHDKLRGNLWLASGQRITTRARSVSRTWCMMCVACIHVALDNAIVSPQPHCRCVFKERASRC